VNIPLVSERWLPLPFIRGSSFGRTHTGRAPTFGLPPPGQRLLGLQAEVSPGLSGQGGSQPLQTGGRQLGPQLLQSDQLGQRVQLRSVQQPPSVRSPRRALLLVAQALLHFKI